MLLPTLSREEIIRRGQNLTNNPALQRRLRQLQLATNRRYGSNIFNVTETDSERQQREMEERERSVNLGNELGSISRYSVDNSYRGSPFTDNKFFADEGMIRDFENPRNAQNIEDSQTLFGDIVSTAVKAPEILFNTIGLLGNILDIDALVNLPGSIINTQLGVVNFLDNMFGDNLEELETKRFNIWGEDDKPGTWVGALMQDVNRQYSELVSKYTPLNMHRRADPYSVGGLVNMAGEGFRTSLPFIALVRVGGAALARLGAAGYTASNFGPTISRLIQTMPQVATAATMAYGEGLMDSEDLYNNIYSSALGAGKSIDEARDLANDRTQSFLGMNTVLNTALNMTGIRGLFRPKHIISELAEEGLERLSGETAKDYAQRLLQTEFSPMSRGAIAKRYLMEGGQEALEEMNNSVSNRYEQYRAERELGLDKRSSGEAFNDILFSDETLQSMIGGAVGGMTFNAGMNRVVKFDKEGNRQITFNPVKMFDRNLMTADGYEHYLHGKYIDGKKEDLANLVSNMDRIMSRMSEISTDDRSGQEYTDLQRELFDNITERGITNGNYAMMKSLYEDIRDMEPDAAERAGFVTDENSPSYYKTLAEGFIEETGKLQAEFIGMQQKYNYGDDEILAGVPKLGFKLLMSKRNAERELKALRDQDSLVTDDYVTAKAQERLEDFENSQEFIGLEKNKRDIETVLDNLEELNENDLLTLKRRFGLDNNLTVDQIREQLTNYISEIETSQKKWISENQEQYDKHKGEDIGDYYDNLLKEDEQLSLESERVANIERLANNADQYDKRMQEFLNPNKRKSLMKKIYGEYLDDMITNYDDVLDEIKNATTVDELDELEEQVKRAENPLLDGVLKDKYDELNDALEDKRQEMEDAETLSDRRILEDSPSKDEQVDEQGATSNSAAKKNNESIDNESVDNESISDNSDSLVSPSNQDVYDDIKPISTTDSEEDISVPVSETNSDSTQVPLSDNDAQEFDIPISDTDASFIPPIEDTNSNITPPIEDVDTSQLPETIADLLDITDISTEDLDNLSTISYTDNDVDTSIPLLDNDDQLSPQDLSDYAESLQLALNRLKEAFDKAKDENNPQLLDNEWNNILDAIQISKNFDKLRKQIGKYYVDLRNQLIPEELEISKQEAISDLSIEPLISFREKIKDLFSRISRDTLIDRPLKAEMLMLINSVIEEVKNYIKKIKLDRIQKASENGSILGPVTEEELRNLDTSFERIPLSYKLVSRLDTKRGVHIVKVSDFEDSLKDEYDRTLYDDLQLRGKELRLVLGTDTSYFQSKKSEWGIDENTKLENLSKSAIDLYPIRIEVKTDKGWQILGSLPSLGVYSKLPNIETSDALKYISLRRVIIDKLQKGENLSISYNGITEGYTNIIFRDTMEKGKSFELKSLSDVLDLERNHRNLRSNSFEYFIDTEGKLQISIRNADGILKETGQQPFIDFISLDHRRYISKVIELIAKRITNKLTEDDLKIIEHIMEKDKIDIKNAPLKEIKYYLGNYIFTNPELDRTYQGLNFFVSNSTKTGKPIFVLRYIENGKEIKLEQDSFIKKFNEDPNFIINLLEGTLYHIDKGKLAAYKSQTGFGKYKINIIELDEKGELHKKTYRSYAHFISNIVRTQLRPYIKKVAGEKPDILVWTNGAQPLVSIRIDKSSEEIPQITVTDKKEAEPVVKEIIEEEPLDDFEEQLRQLRDEAPDSNTDNTDLYAPLIRGPELTISDNITNSIISDTNRPISRPNIKCK